MKLLIIGVLLVIAYMVCSSLGKIKKLRGKERDRLAVYDAAWKALEPALDKIRRQKDEFCALTSQISPQDQRASWLPVTQIVTRAMYYFLAADFACARAQLTIASQHADTIIGKHKAA